MKIQQKTVIDPKSKQVIGLNLPIREPIYPPPPLPFPQLPISAGILKPAVSRICRVVELKLITVYILISALYQINAPLQQVPPQPTEISNKCPSLINASLRR